MCSVLPTNVDIILYSVVSIHGQLFYAALIEFMLIGVGRTTRSRFLLSLLLRGVLFDSMTLREAYCYIGMNG